MPLLAAFLVIPLFLSFRGFFVYPFFISLTYMSSRARAAPWEAVAPLAAVAPQAVTEVAAPQLAVAPQVGGVHSSGASSGSWGRLLTQLLFLGWGWASHAAAAPRQERASYPAAVR